MDANRPERRVGDALRRQIDCLLDSGAKLTNRSPITLVFEGRTLTVCDGKLLNEHGLRDLVAVIASHVWPTARLREIAIEICLAQLDQLHHRA